jgi:hypothetical protein
LLRRARETDPLDLVEPAGRCSGLRPHDGEVDVSILVVPVRGEMARGRSAATMLMMSPAPGRTPPQRPTGSSINDRRIAQH